MANWRRTKTPSVYVAHMRRCPAFDNDGARCRCEPSFRGRRRNPVTGRAEWQRPVTKDRSEVLAWLSAGMRNGHRARNRNQTRSFASLGDEWLAGVEAGRIGRCKGRGKPYSPTTVADYARCYRNFLRPDFGALVADAIEELEWQMWADRLSREGLSRSRIASHAAVASAIYAWAMAPGRRYVTRDPLRTVDLPPNDEKPRLRVAYADEAEQLLRALDPADAVPYAIACYAGLRRSEIHQLQWPDVLDGSTIAHRLLVGRSKTDAGTERRPPIAEPLRAILLRAWLRQGRPASGQVLERSVMSAKLAERATAAWSRARLDRITLHECRHTYASLLVAAGYTVKEVMDYMGHADLHTVNRYIKLLPQPRERDLAERLNNYLRDAQQPLNQ